MHSAPKGKVPMRRLALAMLICAAALATPAGVALAGVTVKSTVKTYSVRGTTGEALIGEMNRRGPRHGFLARAIAQTHYTVSWDITWRQSKTTCKVARADAVLTISYTYPELEDPAPGKLRRRWAGFLDAVQAHEKRHGHTAVRMVNAARRAAAGVRAPADRGCKIAGAEVKRRVAGIYAKFEAEQRAFDAREHRAGGPVETLVERLARP